MRSKGPVMVFWVSIDAARRCFVFWCIFENKRGKDINKLKDCCQDLWRQVLCSSKAEFFPFRGLFHSCRCLTLFRRLKFLMNIESDKMMLAMER